jgi:hypothetical protein
MKNNELSNIQINNILKNCKSFKGCYSKDQLPKIINDGFYIINLEDSKDGNGSHWCSFYKNKNKSYYFDSYGFICPQNIENIINPFTYSQKQIQDVSSSSCGYYCILFIKHLDGYNKNNFLNNYNNFLNLFDDNYYNNEKILSNELKKYNIII